MTNRSIRQIGDYLGETVGYRNDPIEWPRPIEVMPVRLNPDKWAPCEKCGKKIDKCECV